MTDPMREALEKMVAEFGAYHYRNCPADTNSGPCECFAGNLLIKAKAALAAQPPANDPGYKWGLDYGKDLLKDINQLAHAAGTGSLHRDMLQRAYREILRLSAQPPAVSQHERGDDDPYDQSRHCKLDACKREGCTRRADMCMSKYPTPPVAAPVADRAAIVEECARAADRWGGLQRI